jgi:polysaccharide chain length determinant protein (PEP-CTERM system associated)
MQELFDQLLTQLKATWRYKWYAMAIAWIIALGGWITVYQMPDRYSVFARVSLDDRSMLEPLLRGITVQPDLDEITRMVSRTLLTRANLEEVIRMVDLDLDLKTDQDRGNLMNRLARNVSINRASGRDNRGRSTGASTYSISFVDEDPELAYRVVKSLLALFVERSVGANREDSDSAQRFIDEQLDAYRERLVAAENGIIAFKRQNVERLPGAGPNYFGQLAETKESVRQAELEVKEAENSADSIKEQLAIASRPASLSDDNNVGEVVETEIDIRIRALEQNLDNLRLRYTEQHPDIVATVDMVAKLNERKVVEEAEAKLLWERSEAEARLRGESPRPAQSADPVYQQLSVSLASAEAHAAAMRARAVEYNSRYAELRAAADAMPKVEAEFTQLTRDYEVNKAHYADLLRRRDKAQISQDMETGSAATSFHVIAQPRVPRSPSEPDRLKLMTLVLLAALGGGLGTAWLIGQMRPTINDERTLREVSGLPVLGTVIMSWTDVQIKRRKWGLVAFVTSFASLLSAYGAIVAALMLAVSRA